MDAVLDTLDRRWRNACKVLFRQEIGSLQEYAPWLLSNNEPIVHRKSSLSGKEVAYAITEYAEGSKWISFEEIGFEGKVAPLSINELKDIDSLVEALQERLCYTGNVILGNSGFVEKSSNISDSFYMHETGKFGDCKYLAYSTLGRLSEDCFGCNGIGESQFCLKSYETYRDKRCFELWMGQNCSDCYYCHNLNACSDCMFCFNVKNKRHAIGNLELPPGKYRAIREKLLAEMADELRKSKKLPSLVEIVGKCEKRNPVVKLPAEHEAESGSKKPIEEAFSKTCALLLGAKLRGGIDDYSGWLKRHVRATEKCASAASKKPVYRWDYCCYFMLPKDRLLGAEEARALGESEKLGEPEAAGIRIANAHEKIGRIAFFTPEYQEGANANVIECPTTTSSASCYRSSPIVYAKYCAYCFWPRSTEHAFGSGALLDSEFCINCYHSVKLKRCTECDSCRDCSGSYFCHNCENVHDSMFCFNTKNKKYAIGNVEVGREKFMQAKKLLLEWVVGNLEKRKDLQLDIYNVGAFGKK